MEAPALSPPEQHTRLIRSYALPEDAERAREVLADSSIGSSIRILYGLPGKDKKPNITGCTLSVAPADAAAAARLLLKMPPSEAPRSSRAQSSSGSGGEKGSSGRGRDEGPSRLIRRSGPPPKQRGNFLMIGIAIACAAGAVLYAGVELMKPRKKSTPPRNTNYRIEEDLNGDTLPDVIREYTPRWEQVFHAEDRNFDDQIDIQWSYLRGRPATREVDINYDGKFDERTVFDPEGQQFFTDFRPGSKGPVLRRLLYRHGLLWKELEDRDADSKFDYLKEYDRFASVTREEKLPPDSAENEYPKWPLPEWPDDEDQVPKLMITPGAPPPPKP